MTDATPRLLTSDLLLDLERRLEAVGAPVGALRPGLNDREMDALTTEIGVSLSSEARVWWAWHDGVDLDAAPASRLRFGPRWEPFPLAVAVQDAQLKRQMATAATEANSDFHNSDWPESWITLCGEASYPRIACDCAASPGGPSSVHYFDPEANMEPTRPRLPSIGELVHVWIEAFDDGTWHIDPATGDFALLDPTELLNAKGPDIADLL